MSVKIPAEIAKKIQELKPQVLNLDLASIMELEVLDQADWLVSQYTDWCKEEAEEEALTIDHYTEIFRQCIYESIGEIDRQLRDHMHKVFHSARALFSKFYDYSLPEEIVSKFYERAQEIIQEYLTKFINNAKYAQYYATAHT